MTLEPDHLHIRVDRGYTRFLMGDVDAAMVDYDFALAQQPDHALARGYLGLAYQTQGRLDEALVELRRSAELTPSMLWQPPPVEEWIAECERLIAERDGE